MIKCHLCDNEAMCSVVGMVDYPDEGTDGFAYCNLCAEHRKELDEYMDSEPDDFDFYGFLNIYHEEEGKPRND